MEGDGPYLAARDLLMRLPPRIGEQPFQKKGETPLEAALRIARSNHRAGPARATARRKLGDACRHPLLEGNQRRGIRAGSDGEQRAFSSEQQLVSTGTVKVLFCPVYGREAKEAKPMSMNDAPPREFLTRKEAGELLRLDVKTIDRYRQRGALPAQRLIGRSVRFRRDDVLKLVRS